jgi:hypothetical protein
MLDDYISDYVEIPVQVEQSISYLFLAGFAFFVAFTMTFLGMLVLIDVFPKEIDVVIITALITATIVACISAFFTGRWAKRRNIQQLKNKAGYFTVADGTVWRMKKTKVEGVDYLTFNDLTEEIHNGARFVQFTWTISFIKLTLCPASKIYFLRHDENAFCCGGWKYALLSMIFGWWGFFGPIFTILSIVRSFKGIDVTDMAYSSLR